MKSNANFSEQLVGRGFPFDNFLQRISNERECTNRPGSLQLAVVPPGRVSPRNPLAADCQATSEVHRTQTGASNWQAPRENEE